MNLHITLRWSVLLLLALDLVACATPIVPPPFTAVPAETPLPKPTAAPIPTDTLVMATNTLEPTATSAPTVTPMPTVTPVPPTSTVMPTKITILKPTQTKSQASVPPIAVSSKPSTLQKSNEQAFSTAQAIVGLLDQMSGGGVELCAPLIEKYQSIHTAPTYDMNSQSNEAQQAYGLYRQGIDLMDTKSGTILSCGQGNGPIGGIELGMARQTVSRAIDLFGRARDVINLAPGVSTLSPLEAVITQMLRSVEGIGGVVNRLPKYGSARLIPSDARCIEVVAYHNAIPAFVMDPSDQPPPVQAAYQLYQEAVNLYKVEVSNFPKMCASEGGMVTGKSMGDLHFKIVKITGKLGQALNALKR